MHFLGVGGHMRRIYNPMDYKFLEPFYGMNTFITVAALCLGTSQIFFVINFIWSLFAGPRATENPWRANTLEWDAPSPPPHGNFLTPPVVYRGPYEFSSPEVEEDWLPQSRRLEITAGGGGH
jgi:cytochrome c oxidase subunit I